MKKYSYEPYTSVKEDEVNYGSIPPKDHDVLLKADPPGKGTHRCQSDLMSQVHILLQIPTAFAGSVFTREWICLYYLLFISTGSSEWIKEQLRLCSWKQVLLTMNSREYLIYN